MKLLIINSAKGGVGKTWLVKGLASSLSGNIAVADMDVTTPNINKIDGVSVHTFESTKIPTKNSISRFIKNLSNNIKEDTDWLLIDTPPTMSETYITIAEQFDNARYLFVTTAGEDAINDTRAGMSFFTRRGATAIGLVQNMLCKEIGLEFDSVEKLGLKTLSKFSLSKTKPKKKFLELAKIIEKSVTEDGRIITPKFGPVINSIVTKEDIAKEHPRYLKFYNLETWEYVREKILDSEFEVNYQLDGHSISSHFDISRKKLKKIIELGSSCMVLIGKHLNVKNGPRQASIIEVEIDYQNPISKGLPMFLTKTGAYLWHHEVSIVDDSMVQETIEGGGVEINSGEILLNLFDTLYIPRAFYNNFSLDQEFYTIKKWFKDTKAKWTKKQVAYLLYKLEDDDGVPFNKFSIDNYRKKIIKQQDLYNGDFLSHFENCLALQN